MSQSSLNYSTNPSRPSEVASPSTALLSPDQARAAVTAGICDLEAKNLKWSVILAVMADLALKRGQSHLAKVLVDAAHAVYSIK